MNRNTTRCQMPLKANKVTQVPKLVWMTRSTITWWISVYDGPQHQRNSPVLSSLTACKLATHGRHLVSTKAFVIFRVFDWNDHLPPLCPRPPSYALNEIYPHRLHSLLTNQHKNADVSLFDLRSCIPEKITVVRFSKLPPLLRGGDKRI